MRPETLSNAPQIPPVKKGRGCFFYGCLTASIFTVLLGIILFFVSRELWNAFEDWTDSAPRELPRIEQSVNSYLPLKSRVDEFFAQLEKGNVPPPLELNSAEVNTLIAARPGLEKIRDSFFITLEDDRVKGVVSLPLDQFGLTSRFFNGSGVFEIGVTDGRPVLRVQELEVKGTPVPEMFIQQLGSGNILDKIEEGGQPIETNPVLKKIDRIEVKHGLLRIIPKSDAK